MKHKTILIIRHNKRKRAYTGVDDWSKEFYTDKNQEGLSMVTAQVIMKLLRNGGVLHQGDYKEMCEELNITYKVYNNVINHLKAAGCIFVEGRLYKLSSEYELSLQAKIDFWKALKEQYNDPSSRIV